LKREAWRAMDGPRHFAVPSLACGRKKRGGRTGVGASNCSSPRSGRRDYDWRMPRGLESHMDEAGDNRIRYVMI
jgi:hypothetical protein